MHKRRHIEEINIEEHKYENGPLPCLPMEIVRIIWEQRAILRLRDSITKFIYRDWLNHTPCRRYYKDQAQKEENEVKHREWLLLANNAITRFWFDVCDWLQANKAVLAGSACVDALIGNNASEWEVQNYDIFVRQEDLTKDAVNDMEQIIKRALCHQSKYTVSKLETECILRHRKRNFLTYPVAVFGLRSVIDLSLGLEPFIQITIASANEIGTPFYTADELRKFEIRRLIYEVFDIKICASSFDGRDFHIVDWIYTIRGMSRAIPDIYQCISETHKQQNIHGRTPVTKRPFLSYQTSNAIDEPIFCSWFPMPHSGSYIVGKRLAEWATVNGMGNQEQRSYAFTRLLKYINRGLILTLGMHFVRDKTKSVMSVVHSEGTSRSFRSLNGLIDSLSSK